MAIVKLSTVLPVEDLSAAVAAWTAALGKGPDLLDGDRWAQFDQAGARIALAGTDRVDSVPSMMAKVDDLERHHAHLKAAGLVPGPIAAGLHERRFNVGLPGGPMTFYQPL